MKSKGVGTQPRLLLLLVALSMLLSPVNANYSNGNDNSTIIVSDILVPTSVSKVPIPPASARITTLLTSTLSSIVPTAGPTAAVWPVMTTTPKFTSTMTFSDPVATGSAENLEQQHDDASLISSDPAATVSFISSPALETSSLLAPIGSTAGYKDRARLTNHLLSRDDRPVDIDNSSDPSRSQLQVASSVRLETGAACSASPPSRTYDGNLLQPTDPELRNGSSSEVAQGEAGADHDTTHPKYSDNAIIFAFNGPVLDDQHAFFEWLSDDRGIKLTYNASKGDIDGNFTGFLTRTGESSAPPVFVTAKRRVVGAGLPLYGAYTLECLVNELYQTRKSTEICFPQDIADRMRHKLHLTLQAIENEHARTNQLNDDSQTTTSYKKELTRQMEIGLKQLTVDQSNLSREKQILENDFSEKNRQLAIDQQVHWEEIAAEKAKLQEEKKLLNDRLEEIRRLFIGLLLIIAYLAFLTLSDDLQKMFIMFSRLCSSVKVGSSYRPGRPSSPNKKFSSLTSWCSSFSKKSQNETATSSSRSAARRGAKQTSVTAMQWLGTCLGVSAVPFARLILAIKTVSRSLSQLPRSAYLQLEGVIAVGYAALTRVRRPAAWQVSNARRMMFKLEPIIQGPATYVSRLLTVVRLFLDKSIPATKTAMKSLRQSLRRPLSKTSTGSKVQEWTRVFKWVSAFWFICGLQVRNWKDQIVRLAFHSLYKRPNGTAISLEACQDPIPPLNNDLLELDVPPITTQAVQTETDGADVPLVDQEHRWSTGAIQETEEEVHIVTPRPRSPAHNWQWGRQDSPFVERYLRKRGQGLFSMRSRSPSPVMVERLEDDVVPEQSLARPSTPPAVNCAVDAALDLAAGTPIVAAIEIQTASDCNGTGTAPSSDSEPVTATTLKNASQSCIEPPLVITAPVLSDTAIEGAQLDQASSTPQVPEVATVGVSVDHDALDPNGTNVELAILTHVYNLDEQAEESTVISAPENCNELNAESTLEELGPASGPEPVVAFCNADTQDSARLPATNNTALKLSLCLQNTPVAMTSTTESFAVEEEKAAEVEHSISVENASVQAEEEIFSTVKEEGQHAIDTTSKMASKEESDVLDTIGSAAVGPQVENLTSKDLIAKSTEQETTCTSGNAVVGEDMHAVDSTSATAMSSPVVADVAGTKDNPVPSSTPAPIDSTWSKLPDPTSKLIAETPSVTMVPSPKSSAFSSTTYDREAPSAFSFSTYGEKTPFAFGPGTPLAPAVNTALVNTPQPVVNPFAKRPRGAPARSGLGSQASVSAFGSNSVFTKQVTSTVTTAGPEGAFLAPAFRSPTIVTTAPTATTPVRSAEKRVNESPQALTSSVSAPPTNTPVANKAREGSLPTRPSNSLLTSAWAPRIDTQPTTHVPQRTSVAVSPVAQGSARLPLSSSRHAPVSRAAVTSPPRSKPSATPSRRLTAKETRELERL
ncbi:hypothetical protein QFC24_005652 [Naganishia onofrii]|uniref:Uncharacterized protein n=1 Tax=Naganishia onofrii TaxID=1851511 RepID=A0ACC2X7M9_9TREE|nr:hypothetical protein QFC24_005652 [Naganishia onofrii]